MKDDKILESTPLRTCDKCHSNFLLPPSYTQNVCEKCYNGEWGTAKFMEEVAASELDLEGESPTELVHKLKKSNSLNLGEGGDAASHEEYASNHANVQDPRDDEEDSENSLDQHERQAKDKLEEQIRQEQLQMKAEKKIIIGSGFTFDMTDFFNFKRKKELSSEGQGSFLEEISGGPLSWIILLYTVTSSAIIPGWIMNIGATKFVRQVWRFFMQAIFMIPFMMYERRTVPPQVREKYSLAYIFDRKNIIKPYISSLSASLFFLFVLSSFEWTYVSHGIVLGALSNFFLSIGRSLRKQSHHIETGGQILVTLGVIFAIQDTIFLDGDEFTETDLGMQNTFYMRRTWWERLAGDVVAILTSLMMAQFSKFTSDLRNYYPPFLSMFLVNSFNVFNLSLIAYFFNGSSFDFQPFWGIFSIFTDEEHFASFMYMAIVLALGQMVTVFLVTRMFPDPIIPALALTLEPFIASLFLQLTNIQTLPGDLSMMGYLFIFPGMLIILMGQCFFQRQKSYTEESDKRVKRLLQQIKQLKKLSEEKGARAFIKSKKAVMRPRTTYQSHQIISLRESLPRRL